MGGNVAQDLGAYNEADEDEDPTASRSSLLAEDPAPGSGACAVEGSPPPVGDMLLSQDSSS